ncbi:MAG: PTS IIA-like nitrogen regulatory protein PtsN [Candidatus Competibacteraceae bacterium]|nr:PTS IIA-like nitrogen regulatory protein PtsN [Candidatus Competibacteraceae bacterium]MBK7982764.1 PTS IIA-like nitrogen regulatory protein PtsN [Candidatus Competibacteraceae bacterium]MBK8898689.1 PTS IIA-like nitrogen regulatory protein PtsN [Candidatus Competibacteraceae bacterium]MBK8962489.1 PTS IIA-like nitrogen regulatory protein PtsN [Candidatus Competibacteraceae bacterium]MBK9951705.1 PTS IIA-like nitrogen regulatory protein PtsN [Candidatus Competibacteraceae bacterium]
MDITDLIDSERIVYDCEVASKKRAIEVISELLAKGQADLTARPIFDSLIGRERLGSTGLGHGVALPHGRFNQSQQAIGAFVKLKKGVDFDAIDRQPVDLIFGLLVPDHYTDEHLKILAYLAEMFSDRSFCQQLREAGSDRALFQLLGDWKPSAIDLP